MLRRPPISTLTDTRCPFTTLCRAAAVAENRPESLAGSIEFYDEDRYNSAASLQDNILFGRLVYGQAQAAAIIGQAIGEVLDSLGLRHAVLEVGLDFQVGIAGKRLTAGQRSEEHTSELQSLMRISYAVF